MLTKAERRKLAKAARDLAMECVAGTAPKFGTGTEIRRGKPCCALGYVAVRGGIFRKGAVGSSPMSDALRDLGSPGSRVWWAVADANDVRCGADRDELPWTLLWLADELDAQR